MGGRAGAGVPKDADVAARLMRRASDGGDPAAQADVGFRAALGLVPSPAGGWEFQEPDVPKRAPHKPAPSPACRGRCHRMCRAVKAHLRV